MRLIHKRSSHKGFFFVLSKWAVYLFHIYVFIYLFIKQQIWMSALTAKTINITCHWRNVKWFPCLNTREVGRTLDKRRKPRREAEWFPAYRVYIRSCKMVLWPIRLLFELFYKIRFQRQKEQYLQKNQTNLLNNLSYPYQGESLKGSRIIILK